MNVCHLTSLLPEDDTSRFLNPVHTYVRHEPQGKHAFSLFRVFWTELVAPLFKCPFPKRFRGWCWLSSSHCNSKGWILFVLLSVNSNLPRKWTLEYRSYKLSLSAVKLKACFPKCCRNVHFWIYRLAYSLYSELPRSNLDPWNEATPVFGPL